MKILKSYSEGFIKAAGSIKVITIIYGITVMLGLIVASAFNASVTGSVGARPELYKLLADFDSTVYSDFMNNYGDIIRPFINQIIWFGAFYFFFTVFFAGGVFKSFEDSLIKSKAQTFFAGCVKYFFRFLRLGVYILFIQFIFFVIVAVVFAAIFNNQMDSSTEPALFLTLVIWMALHLLFFILISIVSDYAKIILVKDDSKKIWRAMWNGFKFTMKKIHLTFPLYILLILIPIALVLVYLMIEPIVGMSSGLTVLIMLIIQQVFIWARLFTKVWILGSEYEFFNAQQVEKTQPLLTQEMLVNEIL